jgi:hypothetical protein
MQLSVIDAAKFKFENFLRHLENGAAYTNDK